MEDKESYTHEEVKEMFEAYRNLELAVSIHENTTSFEETFKEVQKYAKIARSKIPKSIHENALYHIL